MLIIIMNKIMTASTITKIIIIKKFAGKNERFAE